jgi:hypothetical protein
VVTLGDVDGDGARDILIGNLISGTASLFLQRSDSSDPFKPITLPISFWDKEKNTYQKVLVAIDG